MIGHRLWESSWEDGAIVRDTEKRMFADPAKVHRVVHDGKYFKCDARFQTHPSPQRTPVIFQAGTSKAGRSFATKHAEAIYIGGLVPSQSAALVKDIREAAVAAGRDPQSIKFFVGISPIVGRTEEEAKAKYERAKEYSDAEGGLAQFSGYTGMHISPDNQSRVVNGDTQELTYQSFPLMKNLSLRIAREMRLFILSLIISTRPLAATRSGRRGNSGRLCALVVSTLHPLEPPRRLQMCSRAGLMKPVSTGLTLLLSRIPAH